MNHKRIILAVCLTAMVLTFSGCGTSLNWDAVVPAHRNSYTYRNTGETIHFEVAHGVTAARENNVPALALEAADLLIKQGVKFAATQLRNEEKKYTKQYAGRVRDKFVEGSHQIIMLRLIETKEIDSLERWLAPGKIPGKKVDSGEPVFIGTHRYWFRPDTENEERKFEIASAYVFTLSLAGVIVDGENDRFLASLDLDEVYFSKAKPKVVAFNGKSPVHWASNLIFQSGEAVNVDIQGKMRCISADGTNAEVLARHYPVGGREILLSQPSSSRSERVGDWFLMPGLRGTKKGDALEAYVTLDLEVTERDVSNAAKIYGDAAKTVEEEGEDAVTDFINNLTGLGIGVEKPKEEKKKDPAEGTAAVGGAAAEGTSAGNSP